jgi:hypothetical protein
MVFRLPEYKAVYSDAFSVRATPIDLQITFSVTTALPVTNVQAGTSVQVAALMEQFTVALPLPIAKAISQHFSGIIEVLESEIGKIKTTDSSAFTDQQKELIRANIKANPLT